MGQLLSLLGLLLSIGSLVCLVMVIIQMFQHGQSTLAIVSLVLILCFGIGVIIVFVVGWMNATAWNIKNIMLIWTGCFIGALILNGLSLTLFGDAGVAPLQ